MNSFAEAFQDLVKDMYNAEKQLVRALPKMAKGSSSEKLRQGFEEHLKQTEEHVRRLDQVGEICGFKPTGKVCAAMQGLIEEANEHLKDGASSPLKDAVLICAGQKVEHYEMANYGTAVAWAKLMDQAECVRILQQTLDEEAQTDEKLNKLAEGGANREAFEFEAPEKPRRKAPSRPRTGSNSSNAAKPRSASRGRTKTAAGR